MAKQSTPQADRPIEAVQGHWVLARLGKRVLRPGGLELTNKMLAKLGLRSCDVVELAPGIGKTAGLIMASDPASYVGVDQDPDAAATVAQVVSPKGRTITANANETGLPEESADVVIGEAMLTMQTDRGKKEIIDEAVRVLRPGGRYGIHELGLLPDELAVETKDEIRKDLARAIKVNARPLTPTEWTNLLTEAGLEVEWVDTAPMALLKMRRNFADEGVGRTLKMMSRLIRNPGARKRVLTMRKTFNKYSDHLCGISLVAKKPE